MQGQEKQKIHGQILVKMDALQAPPSFFYLWGSKLQPFPFLFV